MNSRKNREKFQKGILTSKNKSFSYKRIFRCNDTKVLVKDDWTCEPTHPISKTLEIPMQTLCCPMCHADFPIKTLKIKQGTHFSNLRCKVCAEMHASKMWKCECEVPWIKCRTHILERKELKRPMVHKSRRHSSHEFGHDQPSPKRTAIDIGNRPMHLPCEPGRPIRLEPGSKLAAKFPHLVKDITPTKGSGVGVGT